jgi:hypothetical protein
MIHISFKPFYSAVYNCAVVRFSSAALSNLFFEESQFCVRVPVAMGDPSVEKFDHSWEFVSCIVVAVFAFELIDDFFT